MSKSNTPAYVPVGDYLEKIKTCSPAAVFKDAPFDYLDIGSVDRDTKTVTGATKTKGVEAPSRARQVVQAGDVLVSTVRPNLNAVAQVGEEYHNAVASTGFCVLRPKAGVLHSNYLLHWVKSPAFINDMVARATGANYPAVSDKTVKTSLIPLPSFEEQQRIAETLDTADALRRKDQELLRKYDDLAQSLFYEMFGDPVENDKGWQVKPLGELTSKITDGTHQTPTYVESGVPFWRVTDLTESNSSKKFITHDEHLILTKRCKPERGDVLYSKNGTIGVAKVVDWDYEFSIFVSLCLLKVKKDVLNPKFLEFFLNTPFALNQAKKHSKTGTVTNLHLNEIKNILVPVPDFATQERFLKAVTSIEAQKALIRNGENLFETVLNSCL